METENTIADNQSSQGIEQAPLVALPKQSSEPDAERAASEDAALLLESPLSTLPVQLDVCIPLPSFRVADLVALKPGRVLGSVWGSTDDVPLWCGHIQMVWTEFEVVDQKIAVRVTRLV
jgi:flagellar motor switch protein FliN